MYQKGFRDAAERLFRFVKGYRKTARILEISHTTMRRWLQIRSHRLRKLPKQNCPSIVQAIRVSIAQNPFYTCSQLRRIVHEKTGLHVSRQLVSCAIRKAGYNKLKCRSDSSNVNSKESYATFLNCLRDCIGNGKTIIAVDECGFDKRLIPLTGYGEKGKRLRIHNKSARSWKRTHMIASLTNHGDVQYVLHDTAIYADLFANFVGSLPYPSGSVLLLDNVRFHHSPVVAKMIASKGYEALYTPPYCPDANPIEHFFGVVKHHFRRSWGEHIIANRITKDDTEYRNLLEETVCATGMMVNPDGLFGSAIRWLGDRLHKETQTSGEAHPFT